MAVCYLIGAGECREPITPGPNDFIIAADGGLFHLAARGIRPHLAVGDFDSGEAPRGEEIPVLRHPAVKDETDMALALREGVARGYREFYLYGGLGGARLDHTVANFSLLLFAAKNDLIVTAFLGNQRVRVLRNREAFTLPPAVQGYFSLFAVGGEVRGVTVKGARYPLADATLTPEYPLGVSNEPLLGEETTISHQEGYLLLIWEESDTEKEKTDASL